MNQPPPILRFDPTIPKCSRCGIVYGDLELTLRFPDGRIGIMVFKHKPGCHWIASKTGKDLAAWLRKEGYLPTYH